MNRNISHLRQRKYFLAAAASGLKCAKHSVVVQLRLREAHELSPTDIRVGFTATKKLGNAVVRNRVKRRLRAACAQLVPELGLVGGDYVFIGRDATCKGTFDGLIDDMKHALKRLAKQVSETRSQKPENQKPENQKPENQKPEQ